MRFVNEKTSEGRENLTLPKSGQKPKEQLSGLSGLNQSANALGA